MPRRPFKKLHGFMKCGQKELKLVCAGRNHDWQLKTSHYPWISQTLKWLHRHFFLKSVWLLKSEQHESYFGTKMVNRHFFGEDIFFWWVILFQIQIMPLGCVLLRNGAQKNWESNFVTKCKAMAFQKKDCIRQEYTNFW